MCVCVCACQVYRYLGFMYVYKGRGCMYSVGPRNTRVCINAYKYLKEGIPVGYFSLMFLAGLDDEDVPLKREGGSYLMI